MKTKISIGDEFEVEFIRNIKGGKPVCRIEGVVAFIDSEDKEFVAPRSQWLVSVKEIRPYHLVVTPLVKTRTAKETMDDAEAKLRSFIKERKERIKVVKGYQYQSYNQLHTV